jgi:hypothetical protein
VSPCNFVLYVDKEHPLELQHVLAAMWKKTVDNLYELSNYDL